MFKNVSGLPALLAALVSTGADAAFDQYTIVDLGAIVTDTASPNNYSYAFDINDHGDVVGVSKGSDGLDHAFIRLRGQPMSDLGTGRATSINDRREFVGWQGGSNFVIWNPSGTSFTTSDLGIVHPDQVLGQTIKINDAGEIAASANDNSVHFLQNGVANYIGMWGCPVDATLGLNGRGDVSYGYSGPVWIYHGATQTQSDSLVPDGVYFKYLVSVNDRGEAVGLNGTYYSAGTGLTTLPSGGKSFWDINNSGLAVGGGSYPDFYGTSITTGARAVISSSTDNTYAFLDTRVPNLAWQKLQIATAINDAGQIVGVGVNPEGKTHAFLLTPIAQP